MEIKTRFSIGDVFEQGMISTISTTTYGEDDQITRYWVDGKGAFSEKELTPLGKCSHVILLPRDRDVHLTADWKFCPRCGESLTSERMGKPTNIHENGMENCDEDRCRECGELYPCSWHVEEGMSEMDALQKRIDARARFCE